MQDNQESGASALSLAHQRTYLAAERTIFAAFRTGLAIAGGGSLVITLLGDQWPSWVQVPLVATFLVVGYGVSLVGLRRYGAVADAVEKSGGTGLAVVSRRTIAVATVLLQLAITIVVVLFLVGAFET